MLLAIHRRINTRDNDISRSITLLSIISNTTPNLLQHTPRKNVLGATRHQLHFISETGLFVKEVKDARVGIWGVNICVLQIF